MSPFLFGACVGIIMGYLLYKMNPGLEKANGNWVIFYTNPRTNTRDYLIIKRK